MNVFKAYPQPYPVPASRKDAKRARKGLSHKVVYPVSYRYNGGIIIENTWYKGVIVPPPKIPNGFHVQDVGILLELNLRPPCATVLLVPNVQVEFQEGSAAE